MPARQLLAAADALSDTLDALTFTAPTTHVYNPYRYARAMHAAYLERYARPSNRVLFLGMNPGPWGMAQTGVPFGEVAAVRDFLRLDEPIGTPKHEHPKRPVTGLDCPRSEVSGRRLWALMAEHYADADACFDELFVCNYCPLVFMEDSGRNRTPDKLPANERAPLQAACDTHLRAVIDALNPKYLVGVGAWAEKCAARVAADRIDAGTTTLGRILHPSPASPLANKDWPGQATQQLIALGVWRSA